MMAKMFYTLEETKTALGKNEEEVRQYARDGRLREFRDGPRLMFKADQVDQLKAEIAGGGGAISADLGPSDSGTGLSLADHPMGASGSGVISLADTDFGKSPGAAVLKEDTALAADLGLSGSVSGIPSPGRPGGTAAGLSGTGTAPSPSGTGRTGSGAGITVFEVDEAHRADPSAQTAIGSGIQDQVNLEGIGSGSGLLDLTRESDDTSLGAALLDEITPGGSTAGTPARRGGASSPSDSVVSAVLEEEAAAPAARSAARNRIVGTTFVEQPDPLALAFGLLSVVGTAVVVFGAFVLINALSGVRPAFVEEISGAKAVAGRGMMYLIGAALAAVVFFGIGWVLGKTRTSSR